MFRGNNTATVDEKGRLKIPTAFKSILDEKYGSDFFVTSLDGNSVRVYPLPEWVKVEQQLLPVPGEKEANKVKRQFLDRTNYWGQTERADPQGRVLIPSLLREKAGMQGEVAVMGHMDYLEVSSLERVSEPMARPLSDEERDTLDGLGIR
jgi:MraZ protein